MTETPRKSNRKTPVKSSTKRKVSETAENGFEKIRQKLHLSALPECLPCREAEFADIYQFVKDKVIQKSGGCMYISGVPGTGKTATVKQAIKKLSLEFDGVQIVMKKATNQKESMNKESMNKKTTNKEPTNKEPTNKEPTNKEPTNKEPTNKESINNSQSQFTFVEVNGMKMTDPQQVYIQIYKQLTGKKVTSEQACNLLNQSFTSSINNRQSKSIVLLVDELDLLWTKKQTVMYNLFDWPTNNQSRLIVVAIANTMDLPERVMMARVASRLGLTRLTFQPYTHQQLAQIILSRIGDGSLFEAEAVEYVARKVAALSGDARRALDICRRATEMVEEGFESGEIGGGGGDKARGDGDKARGDGPKVVTMTTVDAAIQEMFLAPKSICVRNSSQQEKLFLHAILSEFHRTGVEEATLKNVYKLHVSLARLESLPPPTLSQVMRMSSKLNSCRLLITDSSKNDIMQKIRLNIASEDLLFALKQ